MTNIKPTLKSQIIAIGYSAAVKQIIKISKTNEQANAKLFKLGEQIGMRLADQYQQKQTNSFKPEDVTTVFLKGILKEYMGCEAVISEKQTKYLKNKFTITFKVTLKDNPISDFIILSKNQKEDESGPLNYHSIILGFCNGCMRSMAFNPTIRLLSDNLIIENQQCSSPVVQLQNKNQTVFEVDMWKEKEED